MNRAAPPGPGEAPEQSIFTAIQSLGLKLEAHKTPMQTVVVDHVEKLTVN